MGAGIEVRRATLDDVPAMAAAWARAFHDDPLMTWMMPDARTREERLRRLFTLGLRRMIGKSLREAYTTPEVAGGATWAPPGLWKLPARTLLPGLPAMVGILRTGFARIMRAYGVLEARHPREAHWYLEGLATDPAWQRKGVGSALLAPVLDRCDRHGLPAYLETQQEANVPFYARHGFEVVGELDLPWHGPHMWLMWRAPRASGYEPDP